MQESLAPDKKDVSERMRKLLEIKEEMEREIQRKKERLEKIKTARERRQKLREVKQSLRKRDRTVKASPPNTPTRPMANDSISREMSQKEVRLSSASEFKDLGNSLLCVIFYQ